MFSCALERGGLYLIAFREDDLVRYGSFVEIFHHFDVPGFEAVPGIYQQTDATQGWPAAKIVENEACPTPDFGLGCFSITVSREIGEDQSIF